MFIAFCRSGARPLARFLALLPILTPILLHAGIIRGTVTDITGATVTGATVVLLNGGAFVSKTVSTADGSYQFTTGQSGRFSVAITAQGFRQIDVPTFYAGVNDSVERNLVLEPEWVHQSIVVTATGTPTPQQQTSAATTVLTPLDLDLRYDLTSVLRVEPGASVMQTGQLGAQTSLFLRGGDSDDSKILLDGVDAGDLGNRFDFGPLATTGILSAEVYRGPGSDLYGAGAESGVVSLATQRGYSPSPSVRIAGDYGNFYTSHEEADVSGSHKKLDYLAGYSWLQTSNAIANDQFHAATASGNFGWQPTATTQVRGTVHYGVDATGVPNAYQFYHVTDEAKEGDQDLFVSASLDNQTTVDWHNTFRYGATRKREELSDFAPQGQLIQYDPTYGLYAYFGNPVTIAGANGYSASGRAMLDFPGTYPTHDYLVSNRDQLVFTSDYHLTPHLVALIGFHYEDERGSEPGSAYYPAVDRRNSDYIANVHGDFKNRLFYTLGGSLEHYSEFGVQTTPRAGLSVYAVKPRKGVFNGTRINFNFGDAVREPALTDQDESLYTFLQQNGGQSTIQALHIGPLAAPTTRTYEGGVEQLLLSEHIVFRASYFHNEFGKQIEYVGLDLIPKLLPNLTPAQQQALEMVLVDNYAYELTLNTEAFRAQGIEASVEGGIGKGIFLRGGYTYLDAVIQRSFSNDDTALLGPIPTYQGIQIGAISPLAGARPFRRPPHTGYISASYAGRKVTAVGTGSFSSRSDDSTYLEDEDLSGGNSLLLPNRNLDFGFAKLDLGLSYQWFSRLAIYAQGENLLSEQHIAPIGYPSLPMNFRVGLRLRIGKGTGD